MSTLVALSFHRAGWLWLLVVVAGVAAGYLALQSRRPRYTVRFTNLELLDSVAPQRPGWRRHAPAAIYLGALVLLVFAVAGPFHQRRIPKNRATVMLAIDTSLSMKATDVQPNRLAAAKAAATAFLDVVPKDLNVGLVSFNGHATLEVAPTTDRTTVRDHIAQLRLGESTAIGDAIETSLDAIESAPPAPNGERVPAYIVLLSDGTTTVGTSNATAARDARAQHVPVETIAFGQQGATIEVNGEIADVSVDRDALAAIAAATRGRAFTAENSTQIRNVYHDIGKSIGYLHVPSDLTAWFVGGGIVLLLAASGLSLAWFNRLP
ncbi:MAG TPA: VWA domain-containing protein [Acidimicrobiales bacterium]|nr:VWA domain-containing protein [Acidimicrobiales bacterium]